MQRKTNYMRKEATECDTREMGGGRGSWAVMWTFKQAAALDTV
jgi:hypothetical protein